MKKYKHSVFVYLPGHRHDDLRKKLKSLGINIRIQKLYAGDKGVVFKRQMGDFYYTCLNWKLVNFENKEDILLLKALGIFDPADHTFPFEELEIGSLRQIQPFMVRSYD